MCKQTAWEVQEEMLNQSLSYACKHAQPNPQGYSIQLHMRVLTYGVVAGTSHWELPAAWAQHSALPSDLLELTLKGHWLM